MNTNRAFSLPDVPLSAIKEDTDLLETSYLNAQNGGKENTVLMHQAEDAWDDDMLKTARYVERMAGTDSAIVLCAGFNLAKQSVPAQRSEFSVEAGKSSGSVLLRRQAVPVAKSCV